VRALALQALVAVALILTGSYGQLLDWVVFADWIFFGLTALTLVAFRRRDGGTAGHAAGGVGGGVGGGVAGGGAAGGFRAPLYPWSVWLFVAAAAYVVLGSITSNPPNALRGALLLAAGVPVFLFWRRRGD
jgi:APA family basic amino acid/polyamine antiporter